jgi:L-asparaginase/Glu-tRNA(Gln) amidotransferase subunit D
VPFAEIVDGTVILNTSKLNPTLEQINQDRKPICTNINLRRESILIKPYVGLKYYKIELDDNVKSVLVYLYHSGTACTRGMIHSILELIKKYSDKKIYVASLKHKEDVYSTENEILHHANVIPMYNISMESAYIKTLILSNVKDSSYTLENLFFEEIQ